MLTKSTRFLEFKAHCVRSRRTLRDVADSLGVSPTRLSAILHGERVSPEMAKRLLEAGVPQDFLPPVEDMRRPGPRRKEEPLLPECHADAIFDSTQPSTM